MLISTKTKVQLRLMGMKLCRCLVIKPKYLIGSEDHQSDYNSSWGGRECLSQISCNPSNIFRDISVLDRLTDSSTDWHYHPKSRAATMAKKTLRISSQLLKRGNFFWKTHFDNRSLSVSFSVSLTPILLLLFALNKNQFLNICHVVTFIPFFHKQINMARYI